MHPANGEPTRPTHVAIIMDGNGRWAKERGLPRIEGHKKGAQVVRDIVTYARELNLSCLTLFAFSSENWNRPPGEVSDLMDLLYEYLVEEKATLIKNGIGFHTIGAVEKLPLAVQALIADVKKATAGLDDMRLTLALSYGARDELVRAMRIIGNKIDRGELDAEEVSERDISAALYTHAMPDPDLLIRTSGEQRVSNFLLWQLAYAELYFTSTPWPAFNRDAFDAALASFASRQRRFGRTGEQISDERKPAGQPDAPDPQARIEEAPSPAGQRGQ